MRKLRDRSVSIAVIGDGHILLSAAGVQQRQVQMIKHDSDQALMSSLALLKKDLGPEIAVRAARRLGLGADPLAERGNGRSPARAAGTHMQTAEGHRSSVDKVARRTGLSKRERLSKLFRKEFSTLPAEVRTQSRDAE
jgi:AraC-like DNA-binding protein